MKRFTWEPGNGSRYDLVYGPLPGTNKFLLSWLLRGGSGGTCIVWNGADFLHHGYLEEKMDIVVSDAHAILLFIHSKGHDVGFPEGKEFERSQPAKLRLV